MARDFSSEYRFRTSNNCFFTNKLDYSYFSPPLPSPHPVPLTMTRYYDVCIGFSFIFTLPKLKNKLNFLIFNVLNYRKITIAIGIAVNDLLIISGNPSGQQNDSGANCYPTTRSDLFRYKNIIEFVLLPVILFRRLKFYAFIF